MNEKPVKNRKRFRLILNICIIVFSVCLLAIEGVVWYQRSYLTPFWVNGQSMYPTLNEHATDANGNELGPAPGNPAAKEGYTVDYGVMDCHARAIKKLKRFDVVITKYNQDDGSNKIKRILGLPGEIIEFKNKGDLYINGKFCEQPIAEEYIRSGTYPLAPMALGDDQYFVAGDNRGHSYDSTNIGPISRDFITGKAIAICGTATVYRDGNTLDVKDIKYSWPRYL